MGAARAEDGNLHVVAGDAEVRGTPVGLGGDLAGRGAGGRCGGAVRPHAVEFRAGEDRALPEALRPHRAGLRLILGPAGQYG